MQKCVPNTNYRYLAHDDGKIFDCKRERFLIPKVDKSGYCYVGINYIDGYKTEGLHRVIAKTFIPNPENKPQVNHIIPDKSKNNAKNLEWCTAKENMVHSANNYLNKTQTPCCTISDIGEILIKYRSITNASKVLNIKHHDILHACNGRTNKTRGFKFRYQDTNRQGYIKTRFDDADYKKVSYKRSKIKCNETGQIFDSQRRAGIELGLHTSRISMQLRGEIADVKGYTFKRV